MGIFDKRKKELPPLFSEAELGPEQPDYNTVLDWLQGLSDGDYATVCKVAEIYRKANREAAEALGIEDEPTTFIHPPEQIEEVPAHINHREPKTILDEDDDLAAAFLDDDEPAPKPVDGVKKSTKVKVK